MVYTNHAPYDKNIQLYEKQLGWIQSSLMLEGRHINCVCVYVAICVDMMFYVHVHMKLHVVSPT